MSIAIFKFLKLCRRNIESAGTALGGEAAAECAAPLSADADMEKLPDTLKIMYVNSLI